MKYFMMLFCFFLSGFVSAAASPNLMNYTDIEGIRIFTDHQKSDRFYLSPAPPVLSKNEDGTPGYGFQIYRYLGRKGTGDSGRFWVKGVLNLNFERERNADLIKKVKKALKKQYNVKYPKLRSMPVQKTNGRLIFADRSLEWTQAARWSGKQLMLSLDSDVAQILWDAIEAGQTLMSVEMEEVLAGVKKNKEKKWEDTTATASYTLPVQLDMKAHPSCFSKTDLGGRMVRGYTGIDIFCFDFVENLDENLYAKVVEVAIPTPKQPLVETITFRKDTAFRTRIEFKLAKDLDEGYRVRITKVMTDGKSHAAPWVIRKGEAMLDVTDYKEQDSDDN